MPTYGSPMGGGSGTTGPTVLVRSPVVSILVTWGPCPSDDTMDTREKERERERERDTSLVDLGDLGYI